jgi:hypothetical protein
MSGCLGGYGGRGRDGVACREGSHEDGTRLRLVQAVREQSARFENQIRGTAWVSEIALEK